jgi:hypothetical protein
MGDLTSSWRCSPATGSAVRVSPTHPRNESTSANIKAIGATSANGVSLAVAVPAASATACAASA